MGIIMAQALEFFLVKLNGKTFTYRPLSYTSLQVRTGRTVKDKKRTEL